MNSCQKKSIFFDKLALVDQNLDNAYGAGNRYFGHHDLIFDSYLIDLVFYWWIYHRLIFIGCVSLVVQKSQSNFPENVNLLNIWFLFLCL